MVKGSFRPNLFSLLLTLSLVLTFWKPVQGQQAGLRFDHFTNRDGLSQNTINTIIQDRLGFIWIGTSDGLNRFDGHTFTIFRHQRDVPSSLSDNTILSLLVDSKGVLWVGTAAGLDRFDPETQSFIAVDDFELSFVQCLAEDYNQRLWIGTQSKGLWLLDQEDGRLEQFQDDVQVQKTQTHESINDILVTRHGDIWIATDDGLKHFLPEQRDFEHYRSIRTEPNTPTSNNLRALLEDSSGAIWIGTGGSGLNRFNPKTGAFTFFLNSSYDPESLGDNYIWDILEDQSGVLWLATSSGLDRFDPEESRFTHYRHNLYDPSSLGGSRLLSLFEDRSGAIWIGTQGAGISLYRPAAHHFRLYQATPDQSVASSDLYLQSNHIMAILEDRHGSLWVGGLEGILSYLNPANGHWVHYRHNPLDLNSLTSGGILSLAEDSTGRIWIGTFGGGLDSLDPETGQFDHYRYTYGDPLSLNSNNISSILTSRSGYIWVASMDAGITRLDPETDNIQHYRHDPTDPNSLSSDRINTLFEDQSNNLWIGTNDAGLSMWDPILDSFINFPSNPENPKSLNSSQVFSITEDPPGVLWVGTKAGLYRLDPDSVTFTRIMSNVSLPSNTINCILPEGGGALWISTLNGLARLDPQTDALHTYSEADGLQGVEFIEGSCFKSSSGELYFGGVEGFNAFYPVAVTEPSVPPQVALTAIRKNNQMIVADYASGQPLQLTHRDDTVSFEYAALDFNNLGSARYAYKLDGFDEDWVDAAQRRFVSYTNLHPGDYTFYVRAANRDGVWGEVSTPLSLRVIPAFWQTAWFQIVAALFLVTSVYGVYRLRLAALQRRNLALERIVTKLSLEVEQTAVDAERSRLARDLHDSVTQSLYSLALLSEAGLRSLEVGQGEEGHLREIHNTLSRLGEISQQALQEMRLMVYQLRKPALDKADLVDALVHRLEAVERRAGLQARLTVEGDVCLPPDINQELYFLAQEALNNALKHSGANAVSVYLSQDDGRIKLEIRDDGRGFDTTRLPKGGFGLDSMRQRAEKLQGELDIVSHLGSGTRIIFTCMIGEMPCQKKSG